MLQYLHSRPTDPIAAGHGEDVGVAIGSRRWTAYDFAQTIPFHDRQNRLRVADRPSVREEYFLRTQVWSERGQGPPAPIPVRNAVVRVSDDRDQHRGATHRFP